MRKRIQFGTIIALVATGTVLPFAEVRAAIVTNVWQTAAGGSMHSAANWVGVESDWTDEKEPHGFLDFRALSSGASVTMPRGISFSGFWFGPDPEASDPGDGPYVWNLMSAQLWYDNVSEVPLRVDDGELFFNGKLAGRQDTICKKGNGTLVVCNSLVESQEHVHNLQIDEGDVRIAEPNALRHISFRADNSAGTLTVSNTLSEFFIGRIYSTDANREPRNLEGRVAHIGGAVADSVIAVPSTNGTYVARGQYTLMLGSTPEATELRARDGDIEVCTLTNTLRDCVGFWRFENAGDPLHDSGVRANTLVAKGTPQVVTDPERGSVLYLDGSSYLTGRTGASLNGIPVNNTPYTVAFWVKMPVPPSEKGFAAFHWGAITGNKCNFLRFSTNGTLYHSHGDSSDTARNKTYGGSLNPFDGTWHHVAVIHVGDAQIRYYIDGGLVDTADWSAYGTPAITGSNFEIGNPWSTSAISFIGYMDDFLIMDRALSADEVAALHAGQTDIPNCFPADLPFQSIGNGSLRLGCDQTFDTLRGDTLIGGVRLQNGATLTIDGGSPATATQTVVRAGVHGNGSFRKDGANLDLVASGSSDYSGDTEVAAGTLTLRTASDLAGWWQFEDPADLGRSSERVNALDVGKHSTTEAVNDPVRGAVVYAANGTDGYAVGGPYTGHAGFPVGNSPYTCAVWVKRDADCPNNGTFFWWGNGSTAGLTVQFRFINSYQKFALAHVGGTGYDFTNFDIGAPMPAGEWHHVAATYNGDKVISVYYDGRLVKRETTANAINIPLSGTVIVGKYSGRNDRTFKGLMDDARIYSRCLTDAEIAMLAAESGEPDQYGTSIQLPAPVAWYTFDDPANPGKDSSANGYDLTPVGDVSVVTSPIKGGMLSLTGTRMSYLKYADDAFPAKIPYGTKSFTIACWARLVRDTAMLGAAVAWGEAVKDGSHSTILDVAGRNGDLNWRFVTIDNNNSVISIGSTQSSVAEGSDDLRLHHVAAVYDTGSKDWLLYVDGELSHNVKVNYGCATPASNFYVGRKPSSDTAWFRGELDEVRVYNIPLSAVQIREMIRCDLAEGRGVLPSSTTVTVAHDAALRVDAVKQSLKGLEGTGSVTVSSNTTLRLTAPSAFAGSLTGGGELALASGATFPGTSLAGFAGTVVLDGGKLSGVATSATCGVRIPDGAALALADAPFATVGGTLTVGGSGTFTWTGEKLSPGDYPIATAADIVLEPGAGWQASPLPGSSIAMTALSVQDNGNGTKTLLFRVISGGTMIIFR